MDVILLEKVENLGNIGDQVNEIELTKKIVNILIESENEN